MHSVPTGALPAAAAPPQGHDGGPLERYLTQVALGHTLGVRRRLGEPPCAVLDAPAAIRRLDGRAGDFVQAVKAFRAAMAHDQRGLLHEVDAGLQRALARRAARLADNADALGADLLHWWAQKVLLLCTDDQALVRCAGLHLLWAHVLTGQVLDASARQQRQRQPGHEGDQQRAHEDGQHGRQH